MTAKRGKNRPPKLAALGGGGSCPDRAPMLKDDMRPDLRYRRAQMFTAQVFSIVAPYICDHGEENDRSHQRVHESLMELFYRQGFEVVTDIDRTNAGLPLRDEKGWTPDELRILEHARLEAMMKPLTMTMPVTGHVAMARYVDLCDYSPTDYAWWLPAEGPIVARCTCDPAPAPDPCCDLNDDGVPKCDGSCLSEAEKIEAGIATR